MKIRAECEGCGKELRMIAIIDFLDTIIIKIPCCQYCKSEEDEDATRKARKEGIKEGRKSKAQEIREVLDQKKPNQKSEEEDE